MRLALLMNNNSYPGREYLKKLREAQIVIDVISIGDFAETNEIEEARCGGLWRPPPIKALSEGVKQYHFNSLKSTELIDFLETQKYDLGIQGGTGILKKPVISKFRLGILNFHPGDLPDYRGSSAPEWQLIHRRPVICTCHLIDEKIDTGPIVAKKVLPVSSESYHAFRASVYPQTAQFVATVIQQILDCNGFYAPLQEQDESQASYYKYIGDEKIAWIKENFQALIGYEVL